MGRTIRRGAALFGIVVFAQVAAGQDEVTETAKRVVKTWYQHRTLTCRFVTEGRAGMGQNAPRVRNTGRHEAMRKDGKLLARIETRREVLGDDGKPTAAPVETTVAILDGEHTYEVRERDDKTEVVKRDYDAALAGDPGALLRVLRTSYDLTVLPEEAFADRKAWVIEARPQAPPPPMPGYPQYLRVWFDQRSGMAVKMVYYDSEDTILRRTVMEDVRVDVDVKPSRFKFEAPEGVEVIDRTSGA